MINPDLTHLGSEREKEKGGEGGGIGDRGIPIRREWTRTKRNQNSQRGETKGERLPWGNLRAALPLTAT